MDEVPAILVCPRTHAPLRRAGDFLVTDAGIQYPIIDGIPVLLPEAAIFPNPPAAAESNSAASPDPTLNPGNTPA
jgi:uncharacterized protein YbaR (Trm112 family)